MDQKHSEISVEFRRSLPGVYLMVFLHSLYLQHHQYSHSEEYYTESSRGSDLSDIMEEDEEELYSEMQLEEGRRRSINSHNTLKVWNRHPSGRRLSWAWATGPQARGWDRRRGVEYAVVCRAPPRGWY